MGETICMVIVGAVRVMVVVVNFGMTVFFGLGINDRVDSEDDHANASE